MSALCSSIWSAPVRNFVDTATERRLSVCIRTCYIETTVCIGTCVEKRLSVSGRIIQKVLSVSERVKEFLRDFSCTV